MEQIDLNKLRVFIKVVESGSLTRAGILTKQPKSRVSRHLADLEASLNTQLIFRTTRKIQLTDDGRRFYELAQKQIRELDGLAEKFSGSSQKVEGLIRITAPTDLGAWCLPSIVNDFLLMYPQAQIEIILSQNIVDLVEEGVDLAIRIAHLKDSTMKVMRVSEVESILVASPGYISRHPEILTPEQLKSHACLDFLLPRKGVWNLSKGTGEKTYIKVSTLFAANDPSIVKDMVKMGHGVSLLPEFLCREDLASGKLIPVLKAWKARSSQLSVVVPAHKEISIRVKTFRDFLVRRLRTEF